MSMTIAMKQSSHVWITLLLLPTLGMAAIFSLGHGNINMTNAVTSSNESSIIIPDRDQVMQLNGKIFNIRYYTNSPGSISYKFLAGKLQGGRLNITNVTPLMHNTAQTAGWQTVVLLQSFLAIQTGDVLGFYVAGINPIPYNTHLKGMSGCRTDATIAYSSLIAAESVVTGANVIGMKLGDTCRAYAYMADFLSEGSCFNITLRYLTDDTADVVGYKDVIHQSLNMGESVCWTALAPARDDNKKPRIEISLKTRPAGNEAEENGEASCIGCILQFKDEGTGELTTVCGDTILEQDMYYSTSDSIIISLTAKGNSCHLEAEIWPGTESSGRQLWPAVLAVLVGSVVLGAVLGCIIVRCAKEKQPPAEKPTPEKEAATEEESSIDDQDRQPAFYLDPKPGQLPIGHLPPLEKTAETSVPPAPDDSTLVNGAWINHSPLPPTHPVQSKDNVAANHRPPKNPDGHNGIHHNATVTPLPVRREMSELTTATTRNYRKPKKKGNKNFDQGRQSHTIKVPSNHIDTLNVENLP